MYQSTLYSPIEVEIAQFLALLEYVDTDEAAMTRESIVMWEYILCQQERWVADFLCGSSYCGVNSHYSKYIGSYQHSDIRRGEGRGGEGGTQI